MNDPSIEAAKERGAILTELKNLGGWIESIDKGLESYKTGQGLRIENHGDRLTSLEGSVRILNGVAWLLFTSSMTMVVMAFWKMVIR